MLVSAWGQGLEVQHAIYYPEFDSLGQPNPLTPFLAQILWMQVEKLSVEGLYHPVPSSPTPISGEPARGGPGYLMGPLSPITLFLYLPLSPLHRRIAKTAPGANGAPQEAGERISESQRYPIQTRPTSSPEPSSRKPRAQPGTPVQAAAAPHEAGATEPSFSGVSH